MRMRGVRSLALSETGRICVKQFWQCYTRSGWFYALRKSQLTTQIGNINAKDDDMGEENIYQ